MSEIESAGAFDNRFVSLRAVVIRLQAGRSGVPVRAEARDFSLLQNAQAGFGVHPAPYSVGTKGLAWG